VSEKAPLSPRERIVNPDGTPTRSWWRYWANIQNIGTTASALVVKAGAILVGATVSSGGTIEVADIAGNSLLGNPNSAPGQPEAVGVDATLGFVNAGSLGLASQPASSVLGVGTIGPAQPGPLHLGGNLSIINGDTLTDNGSSAPGSTDYAGMLAFDRTPSRVADLERKVAELTTLLLSLRDNRGEIASLRQQVNDALAMVFSIRDSRAELAAMRRQMNDTQTLAYLGAARRPYT
jgi:hypothetical protein